MVPSYGSAANCAGRALSLHSEPDRMGATPQSFP